MHIVVFNPTEQPVHVDEEGHQVDPHSWGVADEEFVKEDVEKERLFVVDTSGIEEEGVNEAVIIAKKEADERNKKAEPVKAADAPQEKTPAKKPATK